MAEREGPLCGARTQSGRPCRNWRGFKTDHPGYGSCYKHSGSTPHGRKKAAKDVVAEVMRAVEQKREPFYGATVPINARDALREELARSRSIVQHLEAMLGAEIGGLDPDAGSAGLSVAQLETLRALHVERLHYSRISETVIRLDLDALDEAATQQMADRIILGLSGFVRELGRDIGEPAVKRAARNLLDKMIAERIEELQKYAGQEPNEIMPSSRGRGMGT